MKRVNKKKILILILIIIAVIFEVVAFKNSRATKMIDITAEIVDSDGKLNNESLIISATENGASGYSIILPEKINNKVVSAYEIKKENLNKEKVDTQENANTEAGSKLTNNVALENTEILDEKATDEIDLNNLENTTMIGGQALYLTKEEVENKKVILKAQYNSYEKNSQILYEQKIQAETDYDGDGKKDNTIMIEGYMPLLSTISAKSVRREEIPDTIKNMINEKVSFRQAYDITILYNEKAYEPTDFDMNVKVTIKGMEEINTDNQQYKVLHIDETKKVEEIAGVISEKNEVSFQANQFSTYALLLTETDTAAGVTKITGANVWDGTTTTSFKFGFGTASNPYLITSGAELAYLASQVNNGTTYENKYFQLISDIDLNARDWIPIGTYTNSFRGIFDGLGHTITNTTISLPTILPTSISSYGLFGSIGGGSTYAVIKNLQLDNVSIAINANGTTANNTTAKGYNIGIVTGTMFNHSAVKNVILNNDNILDNNIMTLRTNSTQVFVGGITGLAVNTTSSTTDPGTTGRFQIENCYSNTNVNLDIALYSRYGTIQYTAAGQYAVGGIIGAIRGQAQWPTNCLYKGELNATYGFTGPTFGYVRGSASVGTTNNFSTLWNGYNVSSGLTVSNYFSSYSTNGTAFSTSVTSGTS